MFFLCLIFPKEESCAKSFNEDLSSWNVAAVKIMGYMFYNASAFNQELCWDLTGKDVQSMFALSQGKVCNT